MARWLPFLLVLPLLATTLAMPATGAADEWERPALAGIRPGVQAITGGGQCTSNFVFTSPDNASVYLGLAAHCVGSDGVGKTVTIRGHDGGTYHGVVAYSSWQTMKTVGEASSQVRGSNDFALVRVDDADRHEVNPAVLHFGGPTGIAPYEDIFTGTKVYSYGNSGLRPSGGPTSWKEGVTVTRNEWYTNLYTATPGIFGDSGSGVLTGDGRAHCVLVVIYYYPVPGMNGCTNLESALAYARDHAGIDARLATWEVLDPSVLPST